jgi:adenylate cyclase, class 2
MNQAREIEVKYRVDDLAGLEAELHRRGVTLSLPVHQDDQAYAQDGWRYGLSKLGVAFARLRTQNGHHLFTLKRPTDNELACLELKPKWLTATRCTKPSSTWASIPQSAS